MSAENTTPNGPSTDHERITQLEERLDEAVGRIDELEEELEETEQELEEQRDRADRAERVAHAAVAQVRQLGEWTKDEVAGAGKKRAKLSARIGSIEDELEEPNTSVLADLSEDLNDEKDKRGQEDAMLRRRIGAVADAAGVDVDDSELMGDDKIRTAMRDGADAVDSSPGKTDRRAVSLLRYLDDVGTLTNDSTWGKRFTVRTSEAKSHFRVKRDETLASSQIKRVFWKIEDWAKDSPRNVAVDTGGDDENKMTIQTEDAS